MSTNNLNLLYEKFTIAGQKTQGIFSSLSLPNNKYVYLIRRKQKILLYIILGLIFLSAAFMAGKYLSLNSSNRITAPAPISTQQLNKSFQFPLKDGEGKTVAKITYLLENANLQDSFIYQGKVATAVKGRTFLIFNLKITNPYTNTIEVNTKDYIRVKVNGKDEQLAPEIHNDPVQIQAKSTKYT